MKKKAEKKNNPTDWRQIQQSGRQTRTPIALRQRRLAMLKVGLVAMIVLIAIGSVGYTAHVMHGEFTRNSPLRQEKPLSRIVFESDGVLNGDWLLTHLPFEIGTDIFSLDVHAIKREVERHGQVREASVSIELPDTIVVRVREQIPLLRARVPDANGGGRTLLISETGVVYEGTLYPADTLRRLPAVTGVRLIAHENGFLPLEGMNVIADLIYLTREVAPHIFADWRWISLERFRPDVFAPGVEIEVRGRFIDTLLLTPYDFEAQLLHLDGVLDAARRRGARGLEMVDLTIPDRAVVRFAQATR